MCVCVCLLHYELALAIKLKKKQSHGRTDPLDFTILCVGMVDVLSDDGVTQSTFLKHFCTHSGMTSLGSSGTNRSEI